jgi:hypothetical protein
MSKEKNVKPTSEKKVLPKLLKEKWEEKNTKPLKSDNEGSGVH